MSITSTRGRRGALIAAFLSMAFMGATASVVGALLPVIVSDLNLSDSQAGILVASPATGYVLTAFFAGILGDRLGFRRMWLIGAGLGWLALISVALAPGFVWILPAMAALGLVSGAFDGTINPLISGLYGERSGGILNSVHLFFGLGATVTPLLVSLGLRAGLPWRWHFVVLSLFVFAIGAAVLATRFPPPPRREAVTEPLSLGQILRQRTIGLAIIVIFLYVGAESSLFAWSALFLERLRGVPVASASLGVSLFGGSIMMGRLVCGQIAERVGYKRLVVGGSLAGALGIGLMLASPIAAFTWAGIALTGTAYAGIFATIMAEANARSPGYQGTVSGMLCAAGGMGQVTIPWGLGVIAESAGLAAGMAVVMVLSVVMGLLYLRT